MTLTTDPGIYSRAAMTAAAVPALRGRSGLSCTSGIAMTYDGPASTTDDVDRSADDGATWNDVPGQEPTGSPPRGAAIRFRPRGRMPAVATLDLSFPVTVQ